MALFRPTPKRRAPMTRGKMISPQAKKIFDARINSFKKSRGLIREREVSERSRREPLEVKRRIGVSQEELAFRRQQVILAPLEKEAMELLKRDSTLHRLVEELRKKLRTSKNPAEIEQIQEKLNEISGKLLVKAAYNQGKYVLAKELEQMLEEEG